MARSDSYSWMPGWLRRFLNLDDELPNYGPSTYGREGEYAPPRTATTFSPPTPAPGYRSMAPGAPGPAPEPPRFASSYTPPPAPETPRFASSYTPPPAPAPVPPARPAEPASHGATLPEGYAQPIGYALRSYARGALPPQGLEQFTRELRATLTDVWNFYSYWTRFQTDELARIAREAADAAGPGEPPAAPGVRRIKVTVGNGEKKVEQTMGGAGPTITITNVAPPEPPAPPAPSGPAAPPVPTPAAPPTPPAPTAVFSPEVTADDAVVPPEGRRDVDVPAPEGPIDETGPHGESR